MAPHLYPLWKKALMDQAGGTDNNSGIVDSGTLGPFCVLLDTGVYTYSDAHQFYAPAWTSVAAVVGGGTGQRITPTTTFVDGSGNTVFDGGDLTFTSVTGVSVEALGIYRLNAGLNTTWKLMSYYDTIGGGLPVIPNGGNITVQWNASGIFALSDARMKHEIQQIGAVGPFGLYRYRYREPDSGLHVGFMAQEVERVMPHAVEWHNGVRYVDYGTALGFI